MRVLVFDISTSSGWALLEGTMGSVPKIIETGVVANDHPVSSFGEFPWSYYLAAANIANRLHDIATAKNPDKIVIEEINKPGRFGNRYAQKVLDFIHCLVLQLLNDHPLTRSTPVIYVNTSDWRKTIGGNLTKADKALNVKVRKLKKAGNKEALKALGVRGRISKKHTVLRYVNQTFGTSYKIGQNDITDAIAQGVAYFLGVRHCDGR